MQTSLFQLEEWLAEPAEHETLEFKEAKNQFDTKKLQKYCVALANEGGGKFVLGVSDARPRTVVGSTAFPNLADTAKKIFEKLHFRVDVEELQHPKGRVVIFHIPSRPRSTAYQFDGAYLMRSTESLVPMSEDRLRQIFDEGKPDWLAQVALENCSQEDVIRLLDTQSYFDLLKRPYPSTREAVLNRLCSERLLKMNGHTWTITNLGAISFAKQLADFPTLSRKAPRVIVYEGTDKLRTRLDKTGGKGYAVGFEGLVDFVSSLVPSNEVVTKAIRREVRMFPDDAIRELIANALIHQEFGESGSSVKIELYSDRLEISNPGRPPIPTERFIDENKSRNEGLADLMRRLGICEEKGSGIDRVIRSAEVFQLPAPDFRESTIHTSAVLFAHKDFSEMDRADRIRACYQHCVLKYVVNEKMMNQTLRNRFNLSDKKTESISRVLRETIKAEKIKLADPTATSRKNRSYIPWWA